MIDSHYFAMESHKLICLLISFQFLEFYNYLYIDSKIIANYNYRFYYDMYYADTSHTHKECGVHAILVIVLPCVERNYVVLLRFTTKGLVRHGKRFLLKNIVTLFQKFKLLKNGSNASLNSNNSQNQAFKTISRTCLGSP